jgi:hypothetical protein
MEVRISGNKVSAPLGGLTQTTKATNRNAKGSMKK